MGVELKKLSIKDDKDVFDLIKEIGPEENGFVNNGYEVSYEDFSSYLQKNINDSVGIDLIQGYVPQTIYWLYINNKPVGMGKLRHYLNDKLREVGGHIAYAIRPTERGKGYGTLILKELLKKAKEKNIEEALVTCDEDNLLSRKVIEGNNGVLEGIHQGECKYWININND